MVGPARKREAVGHLQRELELSQRRACKVVGQPRATQRHAPQPDAEEKRLRAWLSGRHARLGSALIASATPWGVPRFVDLTPRGSGARLRVAKAVLGAELPLTFGRGHPCAAASHHEFLGVHPIA